MKNNIVNIPASVKAQIQNHAKKSNRPFMELLQYYAIERFLYRISVIKESDKFVLKGALMFFVWNLKERRTTLDIDFLSSAENSINSIENIIINACKVNVPNDGLVFDAGTVKGMKIKEDADYEGVRVKFTGFLEKSRIPMQIDIGFGDIVYPIPGMIEYPVLLEYPKPRLKGYPPESVVSEKFEAMIKLGALNSRMKDFYDIWLLTRTFDFDGERLIKAISETFAHRKTGIPTAPGIFAPEIYDSSSDRQILWKSFINKNKIKHAPENLKAAALKIEKFLDKPLKAIIGKKEYKGYWKAMGPWAE